MNKFFLAALTSMFLLNFAHAEQKVIPTTKVVEVYVNGGQDTVNPGTTCFRVAEPVSEKCTSTYIAVPNNNSELISALLTLNVSQKDAWVYYSDSEHGLHCPGIVFTPCSLISISTR